MFRFVKITLGIVFMYFILIWVYEINATDSIMDGNYREAEEKLKFLSFYHYSETERFEYSIELIKIYFALNQKAKAISYAKELIAMNKDNYHANYTLGIFYWERGEIVKAEYFLKLAARNKIYKKKYIEFQNWKEAKEYGLGDFIVDIFSPSDVLDLIPTSKIRKVGKLRYLFKSYPLPKNLQSSFFAKKQIKEYTMCLKNAKMKKCHNILAK